MSYDAYEGQPRLTVREAMALLKFLNRNRDKRNYGDETEEEKDLREVHERLYQWYNNP